MSSPFVAEIRIFTGNFAPTGWALCQGQILPISQNTALFSLLGTTYGGNGKTTFALPNFQGSAPMFWGQGPGLTNRSLGEESGSANETLMTSQIPAHTHNFVARPTASIPPQSTPVGFIPARSNSRPYSPTATAFGNMNPTAAMANGGNQPHNNLMPYLTLNFIIALQGIFPSRP